MQPIVLAPITRPAPPRRGNRAVALLLAWWRSYRQHRRTRLTVARLRGLSDHTLRDIGLEPHALETAVRSRLGRPGPGEALRRKAGC